MHPRTIVESLSVFAEKLPNKVAFTFLDGFGKVQESLTYGAVHQAAGLLGNAIRLQTPAGAPVAIVYPPGIDYIKCLFGCLYGGVPTVPLYPPSHRNRSRIGNILQDSTATLALGKKA